MLCFLRTPPTRGRIIARQRSPAGARAVIPARCHTPRPALLIEEVEAAWEVIDPVLGDVTPVYPYDCKS